MPGLRYAAEEGGLISIIQTEDDKELDSVVLQPGEALLRIDAKTYADAHFGFPGHEGLQALLNTHTGKTPPDPRQAIIAKDTGEVVDVILAYPSTMPPLKREFEMAPSKRAVVGDKYVAKERIDDNLEKVIAEKAAAEQERIADEAAALEEAP